MDIKQKLIDVGFKNVGFWNIGNSEELIYKLNYLSSVENILYAFIEDNELLYIGKTTQNLDNRFKGYLKPGRTQTTNIRNNFELTKLIRIGKVIEIWLLEDVGLMEYGGFKLNLAAGLEDSLIKELRPKWNGNRLKINEINENPRCKLTLFDTYYNWKCINFGVSYSRFLGMHEAKISIYVGDSLIPLEIAKIDRNANKNGSVRIRPVNSKKLKFWFSENCRLKETVDITIESPNKIRIKKII